MVDATSSAIDFPELLIDTTSATLLAALNCHGKPKKVHPPALRDTSNTTIEIWS
jgi:hypothetical protein